MPPFVSTLVLLLAVTSPGVPQDESRTIELSKPAEFALDRDETMALGLRLPAGEYLVTVDTRRADGRSGNLQSKVSLLDGDGVVIRNTAMSFNEVDASYRGVSAFQLRRAATISVRVVNALDRAEFLVVVHPLREGFLARRNRADEPVTPVETADLPFSSEKAGLMPFPFFGTTAPRLMALGEEQSGELEEGQSAYHAVMLEKGDYRAVLGLEQARRRQSNLIGYVALLDSAGGSQQKLASINEIDVSHTAAGGFTLKRGGLVVLRVANHHRDTVKYTLRLRQASE